MIDLDELDHIAVKELKRLFGDDLDDLLNVRILERLNHISYLGVTSSLYKKTDSNRFSHSINVAVLAIRIADKLHLSEDDRNIFVLYYLFHDIGHIPNSHVSEPLLRLLPSKDKIKFHASLSSHLFESDKETKQWILSKIPNGLTVWESINKIFNKNFSEINHKIYQIIKSPINPDSLEGIFRTACILDTKNVLPESVIDGIYMEGEIILYSNNKLDALYGFIELEKIIYDEYVYGLPNQSAEAMWKKALLIVMLDNKINEEQIFRITEDELIKIMMENPLSKNIIINLQEGKCLTPYWTNNYANKMSNEYANISNNVYSNFFSLSCIEKNISDAVISLKNDNLLALHFSRLREFSLSKQNTLWDNTIAFKNIISIKKSQGIVPLSVFGSPYISIEELNKADFKSSQLIINNIIRSYSTVKPIIITTPFSPNDTNPPAGPIVLKSYAQHHGVEIEIADLNIKYINLFEGEKYKFTFGDHAKSNKIEKAYSFFKESIDYPIIPKEIIPDCIDIARSIPFSFDQITSIVDKSIEKEIFWIDYFDKNFFDKYKKEPPLVGFSIMGTSQLILSMILAKLIKTKWSNTIIVAGGSHITLKREQLKTNKHYFDYFDYFIPFHSEHIFLQSLYNLNNISEVKGVMSLDFPYVKANDNDILFPYHVKHEDVIDYEKRMRTIPVQVREGCKYGLCAMCTYNYIEEYKRIDFQNKLKEILRGQQLWNTNRISFKDSNLYKKDLLLIASIVEGQHIKWNATTHIEKSMSLEDFKKLKKSGCENLEIGIESIHPHVQNMIGKTYSIIDIEQYIDNAIKANISLVVNLIFGFPNETKDDATKQLKWFNNLKEQYTDKIYGSFNMLEINYGSKMAKSPQKYCIKLEQLQPWAFSYSWNAPDWREEFLQYLKNAE